MVPGAIEVGRARPRLRPTHARVGFEGSVAKNCRHVANTTRPRPGGGIRPSSPTSLRGTFSPGADYPGRLGKGEFMCIQLASRAAVLAGCCSATLLLIGVATSASTSPSHQSLASSTTVERAGKADSLKHIEVAAGSVAVAVELTGPSDIVIRDHAGNILFAVDQSARTTTVGKQRRQRASSPPAVARALPDGCEGAFSPYAEPARAQVIGRCVSGVFPGTDALA
jgi:hypothetical protein